MKSFVSRAPSSPGTAEERCRAMTFQRSLQYRGRAAAVISLKSWQMVAASGDKSRAMTFSLYPQCRAFGKAVMDEKSWSPLFSGGEGRGYK